MVSPFEEQPGIISVVSGYTGGHTENPTYEEVCSDTTGHYEAVQITYDPDVFPYEKLLTLFGGRLIRQIPAASFMTAAILTAPPFFIIQNSRRNWRKRPNRSLPKAAVSRNRL